MSARWPLCQAPIVGTKPIDARWRRGARIRCKSALVRAVLTSLPPAAYFILLSQERKVVVMSGYAGTATELEYYPRTLDSFRKFARTSH